MREYDKRALSLLDLLLDRLCELPDLGFPIEDVQYCKEIAAKVREILVLEGEDGEETTGGGSNLN